MKKDKLTFVLGVAFALGVALLVLVVALLLSPSGNSGPAELKSSKQFKTEEGSTVQIIQFEGHEYLAYDGISYEGGFCHSESCPCKNK